MLSGINFDSIRSLGGAQVQKKSSQAMGPGSREYRNYDQFEFLNPLEGLEREQKELVGSLAREIRVRPTNGDLEALKQQIKEGAYRPNPQEIAARMLLLGREDF